MNRQQHLERLRGKIIADLKLNGRQELDAIPEIDFVLNQAADACIEIETELTTAIQRIYDAAVVMASTSKTIDANVGKTVFRSDDGFHSDQAPAASRFTGADILGTKPS